MVYLSQRVKQTTVQINKCFLSVNTQPLPLSYSPYLSLTHTLTYKQTDKLTQKSLSLILSHLSLSLSLSLILSLSLFPSLSYTLSHTALQTNAKNHLTHSLSFSTVPTSLSLSFLNFDWISFILSSNLSPWSTLPFYIMHSICLSLLFVSSIDLYKVKALRS